MQEQQRRKITTITRSNIHSGSHYGASRDNRSAFGYWIPLALTVTAATVGLVAWVWSERGDEDAESEPEHYYANAPQSGNAQRPGSTYGARDDMRASQTQGGGFGGDAAAAAAAAGIGAAAGYAGMHGEPPPGPGPLGSGPPPQGGFAPGPPSHGGFQGPPPGPPMARPPGGEASSYFRETGNETRNISNGPPPQQDQGFFGRMTNALGMGSITGGNTQGNGGGWASGALAAAGAMYEGAANYVGGSSENVEETHERRDLSMSGAGEHRNHFSDQEKWSEEADKPERKDTMSPRKSQQSLGTAAAAGLGAAALGSMAVRGSRSGSTARDSSVDVRGSTRNSYVGDRSISGPGSAAEFYSGAVEVPRRSSVTAMHRKTVTIVVSSLEKGDGSTEVDMHQSILARIPESLHADRTRVIVMIYAPDLNVHPLSAVSRRASERRSQSQGAQSIRSRSTSSYQNINTPGANGTPLPTPGDFPQDPENSDQGILANVSPRPVDSQSNLSRQGSRTSISGAGDRRQSDLVEYISGDGGATNPVDQETTPLFKTLYNQANGLVDRDTSIIPYTRLESCKHILRSIQPELVYIQESLCGPDGAIVSELQGWVRNVVVVIGDEGGYGGLVDSDEEDESEKHRADSIKGDGSKWWKKESVSGLGRGVSIVESLRIADDWRRRVNEEE